MLVATMSDVSSSDPKLGARESQEVTLDAGAVTAADPKDAATFEVLRGAGGEPREEGALHPGDSLGRFVVRAELGRGGMGIVYAADDTKLGREVALKVLPTAADDEPRRRLLREARSAAGLTDPGIATIYDAGEEAGRVFIAMELVRGRTLRALLDARPKDDRALPVADALRIAREVARALAAAHARGVTHRDLKPENVMIADGGHVKILDFGLAKQADPALARDPSGTASTEAGRILGTPSYMSPEQAKGRPVDVRSDVFSFGVMLYELVTGVRPFDRGTLVEMFVAIDRDEPAPPSRAAPHLPAALERVILRCMRKSPAARYADAREVLRDLEPITASPRGRSLGARAAIGAAAAVVAAGIVALAASRGPLPVATSPSASAQPPAPIASEALPKNAKPEAIAAYREGLASFRAGDDWDRGFRRAVELDPTLTVAHLRIAAISMAAAMPSAREHFRKADEQRASLSERDRGLLDAIEPVVRRQPADWGEANRRLAALTERFPNDAELWYLLACGTANYADFEAGVRYYEKAASLDPGFARAYAGIAMDEAYLGHFDASRRAVDRCLAARPTSHACLSLQLLLQATAGECDAMETTARRVIASGIAPARAHQQLALALAGHDQPISTVREALRQSALALEKVPGIKPETKQRWAIEDATLLDLLAGDLQSAEEHLRAFGKLVADSREQDEHGSAALHLAVVLEEQGRAKEAADVAMDFLDRRDAWEPNPGAEDVAMARDATPSLLVIALAGGRLTRADYLSRRAALLKSWTARVTPVSKNFLWLHVWARASGDAESAREAVAALPGYPPPPPFRPETSVDLDVGRTFLLAGDPGSAIRWLSPFTRSCTRFDHPIEHTRAFLELGRAHEQKGDTKSACAAYQVVIDRWGKAKPRSVTADAARERMKGLGCGS
jgi:eukaryotic-like serine/threonine-protein kinase